MSPSENSGKVSARIRMALISPLVTMNTISRLAATVFRANHAIIECMTVPGNRRRSGR